MQAKNDDDLHEFQRSTEVKHSKLCYMATKEVKYSERYMPYLYDIW